MRHRRQIRAHALLLTAALGGGLLGCWSAMGSHRSGGNAPEEKQATGPSLARMDFRAEDLSGQDLHHGNLFGTHLIDANLTGVNLRDACMCYANLKRADLTAARLMHADLDYADLTGAKLFGADLSHTRLHRARLQGALYDRATRWPVDFDPQAHGAILRLPPPRKP